jgi:hypothetical protein
MKRQLIVMVNNSTNINKTNNNLKSLNTKKKTMTCDNGNPLPGLGKTQKCGWAKQWEHKNILLILGTQSFF